MGLDFKEKAVDVASETLKAGGTSDKLKSNDDKASQMLSSGDYVAMDIAEKAARSGDSNKSQSLNQQIADNVLVHGNDSTSKGSDSHSRKPKYNISGTQQFESGSGGRRFASGGSFSGSDYKSTSEKSTSDGNFRLNSRTETERFSAGNTVERLDAGDTRLHLSSKTESQRLHAKVDKDNISIHDSAGVKLVSDSEKGKGLITASKRREYSQALRDGKSNELKHYTANDKKLRDNKKKLQAKLRQQYETKKELKGGLVTDFRVEEKEESKLYGSVKYSGAEAAGNFGRKVLHTASDVADDESGLGIQNAWVDTADKALDTSSRVFTLSIRKHPKDCRPKHCSRFM